jgi:hypothetical protein
MKKKNLTTTFIQLLRTKTIKNKIKNNYSEKNHEKKRKKKNLTFIRKAITLPQITHSTASVPPQNPHSPESNPYV